MITIRLPWPDKRLSPNARLHWAAKNTPRKKARETAYKLALEAGAHKVKADSLDVSVTFHAPDKRRRDLDNQVASSKAVFDGISDATGIDDSKWTMNFKRGDPVKGGCVVVELRAGE